MAEGIAGHDEGIARDKPLCAQLAQLCFGEGPGEGSDRDRIPAVAKREAIHAGQRFAVDLGALGGDGQAWVGLDLEPGRGVVI